MTIGQLAADTIALRRAYDCEHEWENIPKADGQPSDWERCKKCKIECNSLGKESLLRAADRFHGRSPK